MENGYPAYTTSVGWKGYSDEKIQRLCKQALKEGWTRFKMKVGSDIEDDKRRSKIIREEIGYEHKLVSQKKCLIKQILIEQSRVAGRIGLCKS